VEIRVGTKEDSPKCWKAAEAYAQGAIERGEEELRRVLDGIQISSGS
jgi:hypothetical protein